MENHGLPCRASKPHDSQERPIREQKDKNTMQDLQIRRVKCDEAKPACVRCTSTSRRYDGYERPLIVPERQQPPLRTSVVPITNANFEERRAFEFCLSCIAPYISGSADSCIWREVIPQLSHSQLPV